MNFSTFFFLDEEYFSLINFSWYYCWGYSAASFTCTSISPYPTISISERSLAFMMFVVWLVFYFVYISSSFLFQFLWWCYICACIISELDNCRLTFFQRIFFTWLPHHNISVIQITSYCLSILSLNWRLTLCGLSIWHIFPNLVISCCDYSLSYFPILVKECNIYAYGDLYFF